MGLFHVTYPKTVRKLSPDLFRYWPDLTEKKCKIKMNNKLYFHRVKSACKTHALCYACAFSDFSDNKGECNPKQTGYKYNIKNENGKFHISCLNEANTCQYAACMCDKALAEDLGKLVMNGILSDPEYRYVNKNYY